MMPKCADCPVADGDCRAEHDGRYAFFCRMASAGEPSQLANIRAVSGTPPVLAATPEYPPLLQQAGNLVGAAVAHVASGMAKVDGEELARRLAICGGCTSYDPDAGRCRKCGCYLARKARWTSSGCPLGKWGPHAEPQPEDAP
jgi:hypothetical protein